MQEPECHENYPAWLVIVSSLHAFLIYALGAGILYRFGLIWVAGYVLLILLLELRLVRGHCTDCYYYGRTCAFGKGRLSALFFPKGSPERFSRMKITKTDLIPDLLVILIPALGGILLLVQEFTWTVLILVAALLVLGFPGTALVRGRLACRYCRQREIGCPAEQLFAPPEK